MTELTLADDSFLAILFKTLEEHEDCASLKEVFLSGVTKEELIDAFNAGVVASRNNVSLEQNPYPTDPAPTGYNQHLSWSEGWMYDYLNRSSGGSIEKDMERN